MKKIKICQLITVFFITQYLYSEFQPRTAPRVFKNQTSVQSNSLNSTNNSDRAQQLAAQLNAQSQAKETNVQRLTRLQKERAEIVQSISLTQQQLQKNASHVHSEACSHGHNTPNTSALQRTLQQRRTKLAQIDQEILTLQSE